MDARNPVWVNAENTVINLEWLHPAHGWIPFSAIPDDVEEHGRALFQLAVAGAFGPIKPFVPPPPPTLEEVKAGKLQQLASYRYERETAGIVIGGMTIKTDRESQSQLNSAYTSLKSGLIASTEWKGEGGWATLTLAEIEPVAQAVAAHVAACFSVERLHTDAITGLSTVEAVNLYDFTSSWPA